MNYVDGFVVPVQKKKVGAYRSMASSPPRYGCSTARWPF
jgi:uncharacterized protein YbaA (DUF1428 family)